jgi:hypothetical protein
LATQFNRRPRVQTQETEREVRKGHFKVYIGEEGYQVHGHGFNGAEIHKTYGTLAEISAAVIDRVTWDAWRNFRARQGDTWYTEPVVDGHIESKAGNWFVTLSGPAALGLICGFDNRPRARQSTDFDLDESATEAPAETAEAELESELV